MPLLLPVLPGVGSVTPVGALIDAVFARLPVAEALIVPVIVNVAVAPTARFTSELIDPLPDAAQLAPDAAAQVHVTPLTDAGSASVTVAPVTLDGPRFEATTVYVTEVPGTSVVTPSVFVTRRSDTPATASVSLALLSPGTSSVTPAAGEADAVFTSRPGPCGAEAARVAVRLYVREPPTATFTVSLMLPAPLAVHVDPDDATQVHVPPVNVLGRLSVTFAFVAADGPPFVTVMV